MEIRRGVLKSFDGASYTAAVQVTGSLSIWLTGVPVARNIAAAEMVAGRNVGLLLFDASNPKDTVIAAVWS